MAPCATHRLFFLTTMLVWMFVTMYVLRSGTGVQTLQDSRDLQNNLDLMNVLQLQNQQLNEISAQLSSLDKKNTADGFPEEKNQFEMFRVRLEQCMEHNKKLSAKIESLSELQENNAKDVPRGILSPNPSNESSESFEYLTRSIHNNIEELWYFLRSRLNSMKDNEQFPLSLAKEMEHMIDDIRERRSATLVEVELMQKILEENQAAEMRKLQELVQNRLHYLQNPQDCANSRKLLCNLNKGCGFGCQVHHVVHCFLVAIGTERTLILDSRHWRYTAEGWESIFLPLSSTCTETQQKAVKWTGEDQTRNDRVVSLTIVDGMIRRPPYLPLTVPEDLAPTLAKYHGSPPVWWLGQVISFMMRPQPVLAKALKEFEERIGFSHPIAGIHIRRTDKVGSEAAFHSIKEYMMHVTHWFQKEEMKRQRQSLPRITQRLVYLASDDPTVLPEASKMYPNYKFIGDSEIAKSASTSTRYTKTSLIGVVTDIILLSKCDYLVGTFSSQVSRLAYELMQTLHPDASTYAHSLDDIFYFGGQGPHSQVAIYDHIPRVDQNSIEIQFRAGDVLGIAGNHWDGYSKGVNRKSNKVGLYPSFKVKETLLTARFPKYEQASKLSLNNTDKIIRDGIM